VEEALGIIDGVARHAARALENLESEPDAVVRRLCKKLKRFR
jgi:uncharacterized protein (DUF2336 family)